jgi:hypothetical protein
MRIITLAALLALSACGNWSDEDLEYLYALPQKEELKSQLTSGGNSTQMPLLAGDPSKVFDDTKKQSEDFNNFVDGVLGGLDGIRMIPPTRREENARFWGPYPDSKNPGFDVMIEIHRESDDSFTWSLKARPRAGTFVTLAGGTFKPTMSLRKGRGTFFLDAKAIHGLYMTSPKAGDPDRADFAYSTDTDPVIVTIDLEFGSVVNASYAFNGKADKSAVLQWQVEDPLNPNMSHVTYTVGWTAKTDGRADGTIDKGNWAGATFIECWDESHLVTYGKGYDDAGVPYEVGDIAKCIPKPELIALP